MCVQSLAEFEGVRRPHCQPDFHPMQARPGETPEPLSASPPMCHTRRRPLNPVSACRRLPSPSWRHSMLIRKLLIVPALAVVIAAIPCAAVAAPAVPGGATTTYTFLAGEYCAFPLAITLVGNELSPTGHGP